MKTPTSVLLLLCLCVPAALVQSQVRRTEPIKVKIKTPKPAVERFRGTVQNFTPTAITVQDLKKFNLVRTFEFTPELQRKLQNRRIENGERVTVRYRKGSDVAVAVKGKVRKEGSPYTRR